MPPRSWPSNPPLCLGGTFNPPHFGHLITARAAAEHLGLHQVRLVVAGQPPHKPGDPSILATEDRLALCRLAVENDPSFELDDRETRRSGPSFTIETARQLQSEAPFGGGPVPWIIGADLLPGLMAWREPERLLAGDVVQLVVIRRPGHAIDWDSLPQPVRVLESAVVTAPQIDISATDIRRRVREGLDIRYLVPEAVRQYIQTRGLYRD